MRGLIKQISFSVIIIFSVCCNNMANCQTSDLIFLERIDSLECLQPAPPKGVVQKGREKIIRVKNQNQFNNINNEISRAISNGYLNIKVSIKSGVYRFNENHILRSNEHYPTVSICIEGDNTIITSTDMLSTTHDSSTELTFADSLLEVVDTTNQICFVPFKNNIPISRRENYTRIQLTQAFRAPVYSITKIEEDGIYFKASNQIKSDLDHIINQDYHYLKIIPRFRILYENNDDEGNASTFINLKNCSYGLFKVKGVSFIQNKDQKPLIEIDNVKAGNISIDNCRFERIGRYCVLGTASDNISITNCSFYKTNGWELNFGGGCDMVYISNNTFKNCGLCLNNTFCVGCNEAVYYIGHNKFVDFGYGAIGVGLWYGHQKKYISKGIVEHNEIYYTPEYFTSKERYTLMDGGAIYTWTQVDEAIIRYNYIHDFTGMGDNMGIYCDDGASNISVYYNVVLNTPKGYSIFSRRVKDRVSYYKNNSNNFVSFNVIDGGLLFMGYGDENRHCIKGENYIINHSVYPALKNSYKYLEINQDDVFVDSLTQLGTNIIIPNALMSFLNSINTD